VKEWKRAKAGTGGRHNNAASARDTGPNAVAPIRTHARPRPASHDGREGELLLLC